jgi:hypothetical protein|tara:strand:+ start:1047 stop:1253 length:207 start_codon:yes stop_codon:yes gene_type:complete
MRYKGKHFTVTRDQGMFRVGMRCYCFDEQETFVRMWFQDPLFADFHEAKISKEQMDLFRENYNSLVDR